MNDMRERLASLSTVIEQSTGGVEKRIREHTEIVDTIKTHAPVLLEQEPGLQHWLRANVEFFKALQNVAARPLERSGGD